MASHHSTRRQTIVRRLLGRRRRFPRVRPGAPPGTIAPLDNVPPSPPRVTLMHYTADTVEEAEPKTAEECLEWLERPGITWINVDGLGQSDALVRFGERLHFHPLAMEDVFNVPQRPKIEAYGDH